MAKLVFRTQYNRIYDSPGLNCVKPSRTKQSFMKECDINEIVKKPREIVELEGYMRTGGRYGDFSSVPDFQDALNIVNFAYQQFESLSAKVRDRFSNDPGKFLDFVNDPDNADEMLKLGLRKAPDLKSDGANGKAETQESPPPDSKES